VTCEQAAALALATPVGVAKVGLVVNPDDAMLTDILAQVPLDIIQLHGTESPARCRAAWWEWPYIRLGADRR